MLRRPEDGRILLGASPLPVREEPGSADAGASLLRAGGRGFESGPRYQPTHDRLRNLVGGLHLTVFRSQSCVLHPRSTDPLLLRVRRVLEELRGTTSVSIAVSASIWGGSPEISDAAHSASLSAMDSAILSLAQSVPSSPSSIDLRTFAIFRSSDSIFLCACGSWPVMGSQTGRSFSLTVRVRSFLGRMVTCRISQGAAPVPRARGAQRGRCA